MIATAPDIERVKDASSKRTLILAALGAVIGLGIAGFGLFTAKGSRVSSVPAEDAALVNGVPILSVDLATQLRALYGVESPKDATSEQRRKTLQDMIREELFVQRGVELDMASVYTEVRTALVTAVEQELAQDVLTRQFGDAELETYYQQNRDKYSTEGRLLVHDLVGANLSPEAASAAVRALRARAPLPDVMHQFALTESGSMDGEEFYFAAKIHLGDTLFAAARHLPTGGVSDPITTPQGVHILVVDKNETPVSRTFTEARDSVLQDFRNEQIAKLQRDEEKYLRDRADILIVPAYRQ